MNNGTTRSTPSSSLFSTTAALRERTQRLGEIPSVPRTGRLALSLAQERLWQFSRAASTSPYFNVVMAWRINGPVERNALESALKRIVQRHEVLRSKIHDSGGHPSVSISDYCISLNRISAAGSSLEESRQIAKELADREIKTPFDLERELPFKATHITCGEQESLLLLKVHQICFDGSSMPLLARELKECYAAELRGSAPRLPELTAQYYDVAAWQREALSRGMFAEEQTFWQQQFSQPYAPMGLGEANPRYRSLPGPVERVKFALSPQTCSALNQLAAEAQTTLFTACVAAVQCYLQALTGSPDLVLFSTVAGRQRPELRTLMGLLANVIPFRTRVSETNGFKQVLRAADRTVADALANQLLPLEQILQHVELADTRQAGGLFQAMLIFQNAGSHGFEVGNTTFTPDETIDNGFGRFAFQLDLHPGEGKLEGWLKYRTDLLGPAFGATFAQQFCAALDHWVQHPDQPLREGGPKISAGAVAQASSIPNRSNGSWHLQKGKVSPSQPSPVTQSPAEVKAERPAPRPDPLEAFLIAVWEKLLQTSPISREDNFFVLGGDSLQALRLMTQVQKLTGQSFPLATLLREPTVAKLAHAIRDAGSGFVHPLNETGSRPPFFLVHGLGGSTLDLEEFGRHLDPEQPMYGFVIHGLDGRTLLHTRIEELAEYHIRQMREIQPEGPYYLGGNASGGLVAYEMALQLWNAGLEVGALILIDTHPAGYPRFQPDFSVWSHRFWALRSRLDQLLGSLLASPAGDRTRYLRLKWGVAYEHWKRRALTKLREWTLFLHPAASRPVRRAAQERFKQYLPHLYRGKLTILRATEQPHGIEGDRTNGWGRHVSGEIETIPITGYPGNLMGGVSTSLLAESLMASLERAQQQQNRRRSGLDSYGSRPRPSQHTSRRQPERPESSSAQSAPQSISQIS